MSLKNSELLNKIVGYSVDVIVIIIGIFGLFMGFKSVYYCDYSFEVLYSYYPNNFTLNYNELGYFLNESGFGLNVTVVNVTNCRVII